MQNHTRQLTAIAAAIRGGEEALQSLRLILDIYRANEEWVRRP